MSLSLLWSSPKKNLAFASSFLTVIIDTIFVALSNTRQITSVLWFSVSRITYFCHHRSLFLMLLTICGPSDLFRFQLYFKDVIIFRILNFHSADSEVCFEGPNISTSLYISKYSDGDSWFKIISHEGLMLVYKSQKWLKCLNFTKVCSLQLSNIVYTPFYIHYFKTLVGKKTNYLILGNFHWQADS